MRTLVTGASGFIGSHVTRVLINAGHDVLALALPGDDLWRLQGILPKLSVLRGSIQDIPGIKESMCKWKPDSCIHLAWYAEPSKYLTAMENLDSLNGSIDLLQELSRNGCEHFVGAGTCAEYEMKPELLVETDKARPETLYAASKLSFQMIGEQLAAQAGMMFTWARLFYLYGPKEDARRLVPAAILKLLRGEVFQASPGKQVRDYLHVADVANAFLLLMEKKAKGIFNICSAEPLSIKSLLDTIGSQMGKSELLVHGALPYRDWEPMYVFGNNDRLRSLGWSPQVELQIGLQDTINWWMEQLEKK